MARKTKTTTPTANTRGPLDISLGGRIFSVPPLPLRFNREVYPRCAELTSAGLLDRMDEAGNIGLTANDIDDIGEIAFWGASAADPTLTREAFDELPISPAELVDSFIVIRVQTGGWVMILPAAA